MRKIQAPEGAARIAAIMQEQARKKPAPITPERAAWIGGAVWERVKRKEDLKK